MLKEVFANMHDHAISHLHIEVTSTVSSERVYDGDYETNASEDTQPPLSLRQCLRVVTVLSRVDDEIDESADEPRIDESDYGPKQRTR